jgi:hypothetical protein
MLALLFAPLGMLGMLGGHAAMAMPAAAVPAVPHHGQMTDGPAHCAEMDGESQDEDDGSAPGDCLTDCAVTCPAIAAPGSAVAAQPIAPAMARPLPLAGRVRGLHPESADPPPRTA